MGCAVRYHTEDEAIRVGERLRERYPWAFTAVSGRVVRTEVGHGVVTRLWPPEDS